MNIELIVKEIIANNFLINKLFLLMLEQLQS
jgi:hypothetical protein